MAIDEKNPYAVDGFKTGMVNVLTPYKIPRDALADTLNVDIDDDGYIRRRTGYTQVQAGVAHSLYSLGDTALYGDGGTIRLLNADETTTLVVSGLSGAAIAYETLNGDTYWSNGSASGRITNGVNQLWGIPAGPVPSLASTSVGVLPAGKYQVSCTYTLANGEEGGTYESAQITRSTAGSIIVGLPVIAPTAGVTRINIYCSIQNGEQEYFISSVAIGTPTYTISTLATASRALNTQGYDAFPACTELQAAFGRMFGATGRLVVYSPAMRYRLCRLNRDFFMFPTPVRMIAAVNDGLYVSDDEATYWLAGTDPEKMQIQKILPYPAIAGTKVRSPSNDTVLWFSDRGWIVGKDGGGAKAEMEGRVLPGDLNPTGAGLFREYNGIRQVVAIVDETAAHSLTV